MSAANSPTPRRQAAGFTLVEVLVALAIMAVLTALTWRGIDGMARTREGSQAYLEQTLRLQTAVAQWEHDLQSLEDGSGIPTLAFDGASLRLVRHTPAGLQVVAWTARDSAWWRWESPVTTHADELQESWLRSLQLLGNEPGTLRVLERVDSWQVFFYRGNGWSNAQSAGDQRADAPGGAASGAARNEQLPAAVRLQLRAPAGQLTRDFMLPSTAS